jgi:hypothetical protein
VHTSGAPFRTLLWQAAAAGSIGDFGYAYDGSFVVFNNGGTLYKVNDDGTGLTSLGVTVPNTYSSRITPGFVSNVIVWQEHNANGGGVIKKCALDGSGFTTIHTYGANRHRTAQHWLAPDDSGVYFVYDTNGTANQDGYFTTEIGKDSEVFFCPLDGSGAVSTGVWTFTEYEGGNLGNNPLDVPNAAGVPGTPGRFYVVQNFVNDGGDYPSGDVSHYRLASFKPDGSDARAEDTTFDNSGPFTPEAWDKPWSRYYVEQAISG